MEQSNWQTKRRRNEFHDPDYPSEAAHGYIASSSKRSRQDIIANIPDKTISKSKLQIIHGIISHEFQKEIYIKTDQLATIEDRLLEANAVLNKLRYGIVNKYYQKQQIPLTRSDIDNIRSGGTLFDENCGVQLPIHPALKMIVGKRPDSNTVLFNSACQERIAAQNARLTIRARSSTQRREERRIQQLIRSKGIVIDHSKGEEENVINKQTGKRTVTSVIQASGKALNAPRLNNKEKHMIVVANTSQYLGPELEYGVGRKINDVLANYKWLVYVQCEDVKKQIGDYVQKVRFYLHHSFRPNDVIDVFAPPFQIARRGWGEFPIRIELFFHAKFKQKPIQLIHRIVLNKTIIGMHTLGAETLVEIWLRTTKNHSCSDNCGTQKANISKIDEKYNSKDDKKYNSKGDSAISTTDNTRQFINIIDDVPVMLNSSLAKIQPTIVNNEQLECQFNNENISIKPALGSSLFKSTANMSITKPIQGEWAATNNPTILQSNPKTFFIPKSLIFRANKEIKKTVLPLKRNSFTSGKNCLNINNPNITMEIQPPINDNFNKNIKELSNINLHDTSHGVINIVKAEDTSKKFLQQKFVKSVQPKANVDIRTSARNKPTHTITQSEILYLNTPSIMLNSSMRYIKPITTIPIGKSALKIGSTSINVKQITQQLPLMQPQSDEITKYNKKKIGCDKAGKLFMVDPLAMKLKHEQRNQMSLLKPQVSLLKSQISLLKPQVKVLNQEKTFNRCILTPLSNDSIVVACDHDYIPTTTITTTSNTAQYPKIQGCLNDWKEQKQQKEYKVQRMKFEKLFFSTKFESIRAAIEYLLQRIPIIAGQYSKEMGFPFISDTVRTFQELTVFKQRVFVWLRAKYLSRLIRHHRILKDLNGGRETFWSTREIAAFAWQFGWTPYIKTFLKTYDDSAVPENEYNPQVQFTTCTSNDLISKWVEILWQRLQQYEINQIEKDIYIDDSIPSPDQEKYAKKNYTISTFNYNVKEKQQKVFVRAPDNLENEIHIATGVCQSIGFALRPEEIGENIFCSMTTIVFAKCLRVFISKLLRQTLAAKRSNLSLEIGSSGCLSTDTKSYETITSRDIGNVIRYSQELEFLSNCHLGIK